MWRAAGPGGSLRWLAFLLLALCPSTAGRAAGEASCRADEGRLRKHVAFLADDSLEGRNAGYPGEARAADYVANQFRALGLRAVSGNSPGNASYFQVFSFTPRVAPEPGSLTAPAPPPDMRACNVLGLLPGADPEREREIVLLGAHHDGQGMEGQTDPGRLRPSPPARAGDDRIWNGADDNATGVALLLEVARLLSEAPRRNRSSDGRARRSVLFVSFSAEEHGLHGYRWMNDPNLPRAVGGGAEHYASSPPLSLERLVAVLDLEMLGRNPDREPELYGASTAILTGPAEAASRRTGLKVRVVPQPEECCNHIAFHRRGIPAVLLGVPGDRSHYHRANDEVEMIDFRRLSAITGWVCEVMAAIADRSVRSPSQGPPGRSR